jgi:hypothetical protein
MGRKRQRIPVSLDSRGVEHLSAEVIALILRGADDLILRGGRSLLAKVLKGSREQKLIALELDRSPAYGALAQLPLNEILARIDWLIENDYLAIKYDGRLPLLVYTPRGWEIERGTYAAELHARLDALIACSDTPPDLAWLNDKNREVVMLLLERIERTGEPGYLSTLDAWSHSTYKKIRQRILQVMEHLSNSL